MLQAVQSSCPETFEWLRSLRRAGLIDTTCSSSFQINGVLQGLLPLDAPCFDPQRGLGPFSVASPTDTVRFLRQTRGMQPDAATLGVVAGYFPEIAAYLGHK